MNLHPLGTRVLIKRKDIRQIGRIVVPANSREAECNLGEVVAVGPDCTFLNVGDVVTFGRYAPLKILKDELEIYGTAVDFEDDTTYLLMNEADVLCIIADEFPDRKLPENLEEGDTP